MKSNGLQMLVIKSLFININKPGLIGDRYDLLNSSDGNGWKHSGSGKGCLTSSFLFPKQ